MRSAMVGAPMVRTCIYASKYIRQDELSFHLHKLVVSFPSLRLQHKEDLIGLSGEPDSSLLLSSFLLTV